MSTNSPPTNTIFDDMTYIPRPEEIQQFAHVLTAYGTPLYWHYMYGPIYGCCCAESWCDLKRPGDPHYNPNNK
jgi:hypothetical protein